MPSLLNTVRDLDRLRQIVTVLARHGFGEVVQRTGLGSLVKGKTSAPPPKVEVGERVRLVLQDLGPSFVKLGQIVSTRPDLIPADVILELKKLQDDVPPGPFPPIREQIEADLGGSLEDLFETFTETPLASASIAQVHRATLKTDDGPADVVVKVQRPSVRKIVERDVDLLYWLAHAVERSMPETRIYQPVKLVSEFDRAVSAEMDFMLEADNADRFANNFEELPFVKFPKVHRDASSRRVLTLEFLEGKKVYAALEAGFSGETIAKRAVEIIIKQIFEDGFFHADPHPGNVFIMGTVEEPVIAMIDVGLVGQLTPKMRDRTIDLMVAAVREDYTGIADALWAIGNPREKVDREAFEAEVTVLSQKYLGKRLQDIEMSGLIRDLVHGARKYEIEMPSDFVMVGKALMTVEGVGKELYPELDVFEEVKPYFLRLMYQRYSPERVAQDALRSVMRLSSAAGDMPLQMQEILDDLRKGAFRLQVRDMELRDAADTLGRRLFTGLGVGSLFIASALLIAQGFPYVGAGAAVVAVAWSAWNQVVLFLINRYRKRR
ncbi:MAG: ABC1 kinase family protein [Myxococcota bacterium]